MGTWFPFVHSVQTIRERPLLTRSSPLFKEWSLDGVVVALTADEQVCKSLIIWHGLARSGTVEFTNHAATVQFAKTQHIPLGKYDMTAQSAWDVMI